MAARTAVLASRLINQHRLNLYHLKSHVSRHELQLDVKLECTKQKYPTATLVLIIKPAQKLVVPSVMTRKKSLKNYKDLESFHHSGLLIHLSLLTQNAPLKSRFYLDLIIFTNFSGDIGRKACWKRLSNLQL